LSKSMVFGGRSSCLTLTPGSDIGWAERSRHRADIPLDIREVGRPGQSIRRVPVVRGRLTSRGSKDAGTSSTRVERSWRTVI
jgi:hypothetical protein